MSVLKFIQKLLKIKRFRVSGFSFKNRGRELWLNVKPYKRMAGAVPIATDQAKSFIQQKNRVSGLMFRSAAYGSF